MSDTTTTAAVFAGRTADQWRAEATRCDEARAESWERSDTDGFLSQWASQQMATRYLRLARIAEQGGRESMSVLLDLDGNVIKGEWVEGQYGPSYYAARPILGKRWLHPSQAKNEATRDRNNAAKGILREVNALVPVTLNERSMLTEVDLDANVEWVIED